MTRILTAIKNIMMANTIEKEKQKKAVKLVMQKLEFFLQSTQKRFSYQ